jgi:hypothetical protein
MTHAAAEGDTLALLRLFSSATSGCTTRDAVSRAVADAVGAVDGPMAFVFVHGRTGAVVVGRDRLGRRSLLLRAPSRGDEPWVVSSVACPAQSDAQFWLSQWKEHVGVLSLFCEVAASDDATVGAWSDSRSGRWIDVPPHCVWSVELTPEARASACASEEAWRVSFSPCATSGCRVPAAICPLSSATPVEAAAAIHASTAVGRSLSPAQERVFAALSEAVALRVTLTDIPPSRPCLWGTQPLVEDLCRLIVPRMKEPSALEEEWKPARVMVLFSGGLDSSLVARLAHDCVPEAEAIDLVSVCFSSATKGIPSPDRVSARKSLSDLERVCPGRDWRLIEADWCPSDVLRARDHIHMLLGPNHTVMDESIAGAIWLASCGVGRCRGALVQSTARIVLTGQAADELFGGYARHVTALARAAKLGGGMNEALESLRRELVEDQSRLWRRNLGRDDRVVSDTSRELRAPFLDSRVLEAAQCCALDELVSPHAGRGDAEKAVLRHIARHLGLEHASSLAKRAVQFGSRLAKGLNASNAVKGSHKLA